jgi:hypothetical protein
MDRRDGQPENSDAATLERREPDSKVTVARDRHSLKHSLPRSSREEGRQIDDSNGHASNTLTPMHVNLEPNSNVTLESDSEWAKHSEPSLVTDGGMQNDKSDEQVWGDFYTGIQPILHY